MAYLFTFFTSDHNGEKEKVWFSVSKDGLHWTDLGDGAPVLESHVGTCAVRDPFIIYDERVKKYFIIATDLNTSSWDWDAFANRGSRSIVVWESEDLINWSEERLCEVGIPESGCVWAPEAVFCKEKDCWFVFWASNVRHSGEIEAKQRIYGAFTDDFRNFSPAFKYIDAPTAIIDTNIVYSGGWYYRTSKDETNKLIIIERCRNLIPEKGEDYEKINSELLTSFFGLEGPEVYYLQEKKQWCLIADQYHTRKGYLPMLTDNLASGQFSIVPDSEYDMGKIKKRHGGIIQIPDETAEKLTEHYSVY